ncbi:hypothetical protein J6590_072758 [Homalodisca vitripennis]|nr:hypothetical protein J6590_072758 [Homalodisca vitripennis]
MNILHRWKCTSTDADPTGSVAPVFPLFRSNTLSDPIHIPQGPPPVTPQSPSTKSQILAPNHARPSISSTVIKSTLSCHECRYPDHDYEFSCMTDSVKERILHN